MIVISRRELVLDDEDAVVRQIASDEIEGERADAMLGRGQLEIDPKHVGENVGVRQQPRRERVRLVRPDRPKIEAFDAAEFHVLSPVSG